MCSVVPSSDDCTPTGCIICAACVPVLQRHTSSVWSPCTNCSQHSLEQHMRPIRLVHARTHTHTHTRAHTHRALNHKSLERRGTARLVDEDLSDHSGDEDKDEEQAAVQGDGPRSQGVPADHSRTRMQHA
eukprot:1161934-Pelagomonas_calceolata.AAC.3